MLRRWVANVLGVGHKMGMENQLAEIVLVPRPRRVERRGGTCAIGRVVVEGEGEFIRAVGVLKSLGNAESGQNVSIVISRGSDRAQGYGISILSDRVEIRAGDAAGAFYGVQTLVQICRQFGEVVPCLEIEDWPDFLVRGVMLDISRDKVPTLETLRGLIDRFAEWKINQLQLYMEHTFAYSQHRAVWKDASPLTAAEVRELDEYCRARFIELVPNQNSFGHMERWLKHGEYAHLAEAIDGSDTGWGFWWEGPFSLCPIDGGSLELLRGLYAELLPNFSSSLFNVGCDETFDLGKGRSKAECDRRGVTDVYLEFLSKVNALVRANGKRMMFWGDIIVHHPEKIRELPRDVIALEWGYEADHPFDRDGERFAAAGVPFYVCPGTSSWNSIAGRTDNAIGNLKNAAENGLKHGAIGYLNTDWGDYGHLQYLPVSYLGFVVGAGCSWCLESNRDVDWARVLDVQVFEDSAGVMGRAVMDLGNVYQRCENPGKNGSALFRVLIPPPSDKQPELQFSLETLTGSEAGIVEALELMGMARLSCADAKLVMDEFLNAGRMLRYAVELGRGKLNGVAVSEELIREAAGEHRRLWLARNRVGGLVDSLKRLGSF